MYVRTKFLTYCVSQKDNSSCFMVLKVWDLLSEEIVARGGTTQCRAEPRIDLKSRQ